MKKHEFNYHHEMYEEFSEEARVCKLIAGYVGTFCILSLLGIITLIWLSLHQFNWSSNVLVYAIGGWVLSLGVVLVFVSPLKSYLNKIKSLRWE